MNAQQRDVVKNLLQHMTDKLLVGSDEFKTTLAQFNITTTYKHKSYSLEYAQLTGRGAFYIVDVYSPETPNGERSQFGTLEEADEFEAEMRSQGDIE